MPHAHAVPLKRLESQFKIAAEIWSEIENSRYPVDRRLAGYFHKRRKMLGSRDRRFLSEVIYGLFRHKRYIAAWVNALSRQESALLQALLSAAVEKVIEEKDFLDLFGRLKQIKAPEDFFERVQAFSFPEGMRPQSEEELALRYSFPDWIVTRWIEVWGLERTRDLLRVFERRPPLVIRANTLKISRDELGKRLAEKGFKMSPTPSSPWGLVFGERINLFETEEFKEGLLEIQDEGSQLVCLAVDAKPGEVIWDVCAGGGGKSLLMAAMMENKGRIIATDVRAWKAEELRKRARRAGAYNIFPADIRRMQDIGSVRGGFDKILIDAPCSGTGTLRRNPDVKWKLSKSSFKEHRAIQLSIIEDALPRLKKGGRLYYVTCSIERTENEEVMEILFDKCSNLQPVFLDKFGEISGAGHRLWPREENDGFFVGVAEKL